MQLRFDRTADITSRVKMSQEMAKAINDGLFNYEDELWDPSDDEAWVSLDSLFVLIVSPFVSFPCPHRVRVPRLRLAAETSSPMSAWCLEKTLND